MADQHRGRVVDVDQSKRETLARAFLLSALRKVPRGHCAWCGYVSEVDYQKPYCSPLCAEALAWYLKGGPMSAPLAWRDHKPSLVGISARWQTPLGTIWAYCQTCRKLFSRPKSRVPSAWCSRGCCQQSFARATNRRYREALAAAPEREVVRLGVVAARDGQVCHLCKALVRPGEESLDHLVPVSKGGAHTYANVALAHRRCNSKRGAKLLR